MTDNWPFDDPRNASAITLWSILRGQEPILHIVHDDNDGMWQFLGQGDSNCDDAAVVALEEIVSKDPSVAELADLPYGWHAWREKVGDSWVRVHNPT